MADAREVKFVTPLGCTVQTRTAPTHLGEGVMLSLHMEQENDRRYAEVYLDVESVAILREAFGG